MTKWYDMPGALDDFESNPAYFEKMEVDAYTEPVRKPSSIGKQADARNTCSWIRKHKYKKKMVRRFLSINPDMEISKLNGMRCDPGIYLNTPYYEDGYYYDPRITYSFNPYTRIFLSRRGDLRKYHGAVSYIQGSFALGSKEKDAVKLTNRRIRHHALDEEAINRYSSCKKLYAPMTDNLW